MSGVLPFTKEALYFNKLPPAIIHLDTREVHIELYKIVLQGVFIFRFMFLNKKYLNLFAGKKIRQMSEDSFKEG